MEGNAAPGKTANLLLYFYYFCHCVNSISSGGLGNVSFSKPSYDSFVNLAVLLKTDGGQFKCRLVLTLWELKFILTQLV